MKGYFALVDNQNGMMNSLSGWEEQLKNLTVFIIEVSIEADDDDN